MGYYTRFELSVVGDDVDKHMEEITAASGYSYLFDDSVKWYEHEAEMRAHSKLYPNLLFKLSGEGEESGDIWVEYYKNGLMQREKAKFTVGEYNEANLR